uniref:Uncharacterized protein n=1 Tax=Eptatretus burgeri TaxID=7764 RepID=A0A8C4QLR6_EPTBU
MPVPQLWSVLFFCMLLAVGLSSMFGNLEGVLTPLTDLRVFPKSMSKEMMQGKSGNRQWDRIDGTGTDREHQLKLRTKMKRKERETTNTKYIKHANTCISLFALHLLLPPPAGMICLVSMLISMIFITAPGNYWLTIFNDYVCSVPLLFTCFVELISVMYIYGYKRQNDCMQLNGVLPSSVGQGFCISWKLNLWASLVSLTEKLWARACFSPTVGRFIVFHSLPASHLSLM